MKNINRSIILQRTKAALNSRVAKAALSLFRRVAHNFGHVFGARTGESTNTRATPPPLRSAPLFKLPHTSSESTKEKVKQQRAKTHANAQWLVKSFKNAHGQRNYRVYVPSMYHGKALPLVIMLHGANQSAEDFAAGTQMNSLAEAERYIVAYPEQSVSASLLRCWNWFRPTDQLRDSGEPSIIAGITREVIENYNADPCRVYIAGLSAGGAMAVNMAETYPDLYAAAGIHSGLPYGVADEPFSALAAMNDGLRKTEPRPAVDGIVASPRVPLIVFHGDRDRVVHSRNSDALVAINMQSADGRAEACEEAASPAATPSGEVSNAYSYTRTVFRDAAGVTTGEQWLVHELGHAWSGGNSVGTYTDPRGPDASHHMIRFFETLKKADIARTAFYTPARPRPQRLLQTFQKPARRDIVGAC